MTALFSSTWKCCFTFFFFAYIISDKKCSVIIIFVPVKFSFLQTEEVEHSEGYMFG